MLIVLFQDDLVHPGEELRATTAFTLSRVRHVIKGMPDPARLDSRQGRLLKGRLKPLRPVKVCFIFYAGSNSVNWRTT